MRIPEPQGYYDVVIIGAGVGGMTAAALLSKSGLSVCVLEKEPHVGGYLAGFRRKDFRFDTALHWLNQCGKGGLVTRIFDLIGDDYPRPTSLTNIRRFKGETFDYVLTNNPDDLKKQLIQEFPHEKAGIKKFFKAAYKLGHSFANLNSIFRAEENMSAFEKIKNKMALLKFALPFIPYISYHGEEGFKKGINKFFKEEKIQRIFSAESDVLSCLVPIGWAYFHDYQTPPEGGGQVIPEWLEHVVHEFNQDIFCKSEVLEILTESSKVKGVRFKFRNEEFEVKSKYVIAACDLEQVYQQLLPPSAIVQKVKDKLESAELYSSSFTVNVALDCSSESLGFGEEMVHLCRENIPKSFHHSGNPEHTAITILAPSAKDKSLAPEGCGTLTIFMPALMDSHDFWQTGSETPQNFERGENYIKLKTQMAETLLNRIEESVAPDLRKHILFYEVATPITHWRYTGNKGGSMMGTKPGRSNMQGKVARYKTAVENLFIGGHWAELGGGVPIAVKAGTNASLMVLRKERPEIYRAIAAYMDKTVDKSIVLSNEDFKNYSNNFVRKPTPAEKKRNRLKLSE